MTDCKDKSGLSVQDALLGRIEACVAGRGMKLVLPEGEDPRILQAASRLYAQYGVQSTLLGSPDVIRQTAVTSGLSLDGLNILAPSAHPRFAEFASLYRQARPGTSDAVVRRLLQKPLFFGGMMVKSGLADAVLAGVTCPTARVVEAALMTVGLAPGMETSSSYFLMLLPAHPLIFADCALNVQPSAEQLADIAIASAQSYAGLFGDRPRVAMLSFSSKGSARHALVDQVQQAVNLVRNRVPDLLIDGELQLDAALDPQVAATKLNETGPVAGQANVLIFPDLNSGNIAYKLARHLTGCQAIGPVLQGFDKPVGDLSRSASVNEIVVTALILLSRAG